MTLLAAVLLPVALGLAGSLFGRALAGPEDGVLHRTALFTVAGAVGFHLFVTLLDLAGIPWHPLLVAAPLAVLAVYALLRRRDRTDRPRLPSDLGWGDGAALAALAVFALLALTAWIATPDFIFHWGLKGHRFALARGVDYDYLAQSWSWPLHPDYPNLLPELYAATALLGGGWDAGAMMFWSVAFLALLLAALREVLRREAADRFGRQAGIALVALAVGAFGIGHLTAGAADWMVALALAVAAPALLRPPDRTGDLQVGIAAAFAAAAKIEGVPLAAILILVQAGRRIWTARRIDLGSAARVALPATAVTVPWLARAVHHHLFQPFTSEGFQAERAAQILPSLLESLAVPSWHGFTLAVLLPPLLALSRRTRPLALVAGLQLLFYLYAYFAAPVDTGYYVISSLPRLLLQVIPVLLAVGTARLVGGQNS